MKIPTERSVKQNCENKSRGMRMSTRDKILERAFCLFLDKGFSEVSMNDIIHSAGITKGGFYHHFESKDKLIHEIIHIYILPFFWEPIDKMQKKLEIHRFDSAEKKLQLYFDIIHNFVLSEDLLNMFEKKDIRNFYFLVFEGIKKYDALAQNSQKAFEERVRLFQSILEDGKKEGLVAQNIDSQEWAYTINALKDGLLSLKMLNASIDLNQKCKISFEQICNEIIA